MKPATGAPSAASNGVVSAAATKSSTTNSSAASSSAATMPSVAPERNGPVHGKVARIGLLGAAGYTGQEFTRIALDHPGLDLVALASREHAGRPIATVMPGVDPRLQPPRAFVDPAALETLFAEGACDTLVSCLPHGAWAALAAKHPKLMGAGPGGPVRIVDLSSDHRDGTNGFVYGLPEAFRDAIPGASKIANPGCYPTATMVALLPALEAGWAAGPVMVSALSGVSGAGRSPALRTSFVELDGGASLYKAGEVHAHVGEMERHLSRVAGDSVDVAFAPKLAPMARGIVLTATVALDRPYTTEEVRAAYAARYANEPFVRVLEEGAWPETRAVRASNRCDVAAITVHGGRTLMATAALDNLVKGAAGQAIQNLNLMLGWPEDWGLPVNGAPW